MEILFHQYSLIRDGRAPFFSYCASLSSSHFTQNLDSFGGRNIRDILVHVNNVYHFWLGHFVELKKTPFATPESASNVSDVENLFAASDSLVEMFLTVKKQTFEDPIINTVPMRDFKIEVTPLQLFTHVITHEYHHKGQVLAMSRQLGYEPIDTDLIRF